MLALMYSGMVLVTNLDTILKTVSGVVCLGDEGNVAPLASSKTIGREWKLGSGVDTIVGRTIP
jgi:hypothetical protein